MNPDGSFVVDECKLFVGGLDPRMTEYALIKLFQPFGKLVSEQFVWHTEPGEKFGQPRGFCFVTFEKPEDAQRAIRALNGKMVRRCDRNETLCKHNLKRVLFWCCRFVVQIGERSLVVRLAYVRQEVDASKAAAPVATPAAPVDAGDERARRLAAIAAIRRQLGEPPARASNNAARSNVTNNNATAATTTSSSSSGVNSSLKRKASEDNSVATNSTSSSSTVTATASMNAATTNGATCWCFPELI